MSENNFYALFDKPTARNLEANRRGSLTLEQRSTLERVRKGQQTWIFAFAVTELAVVGFMIFFLWQVEGRDGILSFTSTSLVAIGLVALGVVLLMLFILGGDSFFVFPWGDIEDGQVESVNGRVVWMGGRYQAVSDARKLRSLRSGVALPPPGDYRFYCLPRSGLVIMAEEIGIGSTNHARDLFLDALARANHFSMEDLEVNREGSLSGRQELRLFGYLSMLGVLILVFIWSSVWAVQSQLLGASSFSLVLMGVINLIVFLRTGWDILRVIGDIWNGSVEHVEGLVTRHVHRARNVQYYTYQIDNLKFNVSRSAYYALIEGREYRVYFAPRSKRLVAIVPK